MTLVVKGLKKSYGDHKILEGINCKIDTGEIVSIEGKSGEGKTTFLRCINGLEPFDEGKIYVDDKKITFDGNEKGILGLVFQNYNLFPNMTIWENLTLAPRFHKMPEDEIKEKANRLLEEMDLSYHKDKLPSKLSGGQKQRVAIARACMLNPKILCFDEPTSALDEDTRNQVQQIIENLAKKNITIIIVTHDKVFSNNISDRIFHIENGVFV